MCSETNFYLFWKLFAIFLEYLKTIVLMTSLLLFLSYQNSDLKKNLIKQQKFSKNVKFSFEAYFIMENMLSASD